MINNLHWNVNYRKIVVPKNELLNKKIEFNSIFFMNK